MIRGRVGVVALGLALVAGSSGAAERVAVSWHPSKPKLGDVAWLHVRDVPEGAAVEGSVDGRPLRFFPYAGGQAALLGIDLETRPGTHLWKVGVVEQERDPRNAQGAVTITRRSFPQERLTLPQTMVDLDPETEKRAVEETRQLTTLYRTVTPERLWRGKFTKPVRTQAPGTGFGEYPSKGAALQALASHLARTPADRGRLLDAINRPMTTALINPSKGPAHDPRNGNLVMIDDPEGYESGDCYCRLCVPETIAKVADTVRDVDHLRSLWDSGEAPWRVWDDRRPGAEGTGNRRRGDRLEAAA